MKRIPSLLATALAVSVSAQPTSDLSVLDHLTALTQDYARGITENRFEVKLQITSYFADGRLRKTQNTTHLLEFTRGRFAGLGDGSDWSGTFRVSRAKSADVAEDMYADMGTFIPVFVLSPSARAHWSLEVDGMPGGPAKISYRSREECATFHSAAENHFALPGGFELTNSHCGSGQMILDENAYSQLRVSFDALGFPIVAGKHMMTGYHLENEYRIVSVPGESRQFLFPARVMAAYTFASGKVVIHGDYILSAGTKNSVPDPQ